MIYSPSNHPRCIFDFLLSDEYNWSYNNNKKNVLAFFFFAQKVHPSIIKELHMALVVNKGLLKQSDVFVYEKYPYLKLYKP